MLSLLPASLHHLCMQPLSCSFVNCLWFVPLTVILPVCLSLLPLFRPLLLPDYNLIYGRCTSAYIFSVSAFSCIRNGQQVPTPLLWNQSTASKMQIACGIIYFHPDMSAAIFLPAYQTFMGRSLTAGGWIVSSHPFIDQSKRKSHFLFLPASTTWSKVGKRLRTLVLMERRIRTEDKLAYLMSVRRSRRPFSFAPWTFPDTTIIRLSGSGKLVYWPHQRLKATFT